MCIEGGYYLRTSDMLEGKGTVTLASPRHHYENISCIQFYYQMQSAKEQWSALSLSLVTESRRDTIWRMRSIADGTWHFAQTSIIDGRYQLVFELNGDRVRAAIDDVVALDGDCDMERSESTPSAVALDVVYCAGLICGIGRFLQKG